MSFLQLDGDLLSIVYGLEPITLHAADDGVEIAAASALRRAVSSREAEVSGGRYTAADVRWHLAVSSIEVPIEVGMRIVDGESQSWTVLEVKRCLLGTRYECLTRRLHLEPSELVILQRATWSKGESGAALAEWMDVLVDLPAHIQRLEEEAEVSHRRRTIRVTHRVYFDSPLQLDDNHRLLGADGAVYDIVGLQHMQRIDAMQVVHAVRRK